MAAALLSGGCFPEQVDARRERLLRVEDEVMRTSSAHPAPPSELTLPQAIAYALEYNLAIRAAELDYAVKQELETGAALRMLPSLRANMEYGYRNRPDASWSQSVISGKQSLEPSVSSEQKSRPSSLTVAWSLLDFGLSALRAGQAEEDTRQSGEQLRRLRQQIAMETTIAYYRAWSAAEVVREAGSLAQAARVQLSVVKSEAEKRNISRSEEAQRSMPLLLGLRALQDFGKEWQSARIALAKAMGAPGPEAISLPAYAEYELPRVELDVEALVTAAFANRPEMYQSDGTVRISEADAKIALLQMAPNVNLSMSFNRDEDKYLVYNNWMDTAVRVAWDVLSLPSRYKEKKAADRKVELSRARSEVTAASIMVQVNLAYWELRDAMEQVGLAGEIAEARRTMVASVEDAVAQGKSHGADVILERIRYIADYSAKCRARSEYMAAHARLEAAIGFDPEPSAGRPVAAAVFAAGARPASAGIPAELAGDMIAVPGAKP